MVRDGIYRPLCDSYDGGDSGVLAVGGKLLEEVRRGSYCEGFGRSFGVLRDCGDSVAGCFASTAARFPAARGRYLLLIFAPCCDSRVRDREGLRSVAAGYRDF